MKDGFGDVGAAGASADGGLGRREERLNGGANQCHETAPKQAAKGGGELEGSLPVGGVGAFLLRDPHPEVLAGSNGKGDFHAGVVGTAKALCHEVGDEGYPTVVDFVRAVVDTRGGARTAKYVFGDA